MNKQYTRNEAKERIDDERRRAALVVRCTHEEAEAIRNAAQGERRTISGCILNAVMQRIAIQNRTHQMLEKNLQKKQPDTD